MCCVVIETAFDLSFARTLSPLYLIPSLSLIKNANHLFVIDLFINTADN